MSNLLPASPSLRLNSTPRSFSIFLGNTGGAGDAGGPRPSTPRNSSNQGSTTYVQHQNPQNPQNPPSAKPATREQQLEELLRQSLRDHKKMNAEIVGQNIELRARVETARVMEAERQGLERQVAELNQKVHLANEALQVERERRAEVLRMAGCIAQWKAVATLSAEVQTEVVEVARADPEPEPPMAAALGFDLDQVAVSDHEAESLVDEAYATKKRDKKNKKREFFKVFADDRPTDDDIDVIPPLEPPQAAPAAAPLATSTKKRKKALSAFGGVPPSQL
jgi:hypothetical protein